MKKINWKKKGLWILLTGTAALAVLIGVYFALRGGGEPVNVYPFHYLGMTEYWGDSRESYGPVTTDKIQTIFLSDTQTVTEILVQPGDTVKKGDVLMTFDTTLDDLALERKRLAVEKLKLQQQAARERLVEIQNMVPMTIPEESDTDTWEPDTGTGIRGNYQIFASQQYDGSSPEAAMICWLRSDTAISSGLLERLRQEAFYYRQQNPASAASAEEVLEEVIEEAITEEYPEEIVEEFVDEPEQEDIWEEYQEEPPEYYEPEPPLQLLTEPDPQPSTETTAPPEETVFPLEPDDSFPPFVDDGSESIYVVFKITAGDMSLGSQEVWQGAQILGSGSSGFALKLFNAAVVPDHSVATSEEEDWEDYFPEEPMDSGFTSAQIAQMRAEQEKTIRELSIQIDVADAEYKIMQTEVSDGHVYAKIDGEVVSVLTEEEARDASLPIIKLSGGGGFYIEGSISELEMDGLSIGQEVTVNDWNTGMTYTGEVMELRDFPSSRDNWNGSGNPNVSYYPFRVFVDGEADLQEGTHVSVMYSTAAAENGIYLENAFLRTEQGRSYVWLRGSDGNLKKQFVTVGKSLWGSYSEILSGLTEEDLLAFPYGKELKEGAPTVEADISELYGY
ncbi:MAG: biotin/lipoyl-binding protein [Oscillospiraceae bacterium]|nr:biotin/lipoyl-binding protein [Oscillospiraceae bacterium]